jgi:hypothetical protein
MAHHYWSTPVSDVGFATTLLGGGGMIETFFDRDDEDAHDDFQRWRSRHWSDGYFLNYKSPNNVMLHRSPCPHLGDADWTRAEYRFHSLTRTKKVCSTDPRELEQWMDENAKAALKRCLDCERL